MSRKAQLMKTERLNVGKSTSIMTKFKGITEDLKGYTFDLGPKQFDMYENTHKDICRYVGNISGRDFQTAIAYMTLLVF